MKKFFKILMVLALLSGAALSCTKDYSKEIADVQKQNQDLQALVASLQNALNSTNATVSQLNSTSDKQAADIAKIVSDINAQKGDISALMADVETIEALSEVFAQLGVDLSEEIEDQALLIAALQAQAKELEEGIETVDGKATANAAAIAKIDETLKGIASTLDLLEEGIADIEANKTAIAANKTAIETAQADLAKIKEQIKSLSARLTNIVAAPAKDVEIQTFEWANIKKTTVNMNFIVAPTEAAEAVAEGFKNGKVDVTLFINSGVDRILNISKARVDSCDYVIIPNKVEAAEDGIITISAIVDTTLANLEAPELSKHDGLTYDYYATLAVSGEDEVGPWQRVSDPVKPIINNTGKDVTYAWYKGDKEVEKASADFVLKSTAFGAKDSVAVFGNVLTIVKADWDWKSEEYKVENIIAGYEPKFVIGSTAYSVDEFKTAFDLPDSLKITAPRFVDLKQTFTEPFEWGSTITDINKPADTDSALFKATVKTDSTINAYGFSIVLPDKEADQVEAVGKATVFAATKIAFGKVATPCSLGVKFVQRIGKHVEKEEAADGLTAEFGITKVGGSLQAAKIDTTFAPVAWKSTTQVGKSTDAKIINDKKEQVGTATITPNSNNTKFVDVQVNVPYAENEQKLTIVLEDDAQKNGKGVIVLEHGDYIDLTVDPYHAPVIVEATSKDKVYISKKANAAKTFKLNKSVNDILGDYHEWLIKDGKLENADSTIVKDWFKVDGTSVDAKQGTAKVGEAKLRIINDTLTVVDFKVTDKNKFKEGTSVTIEKKDSIDLVNKFTYKVSFTPEKVGVKVVAIPGFVVDNVITVEGKLNEAEDDYVIDDINLANYFKVTGLEKKSADDADIKVKFSDDTTGLIYSIVNAVDSIYVATDEGKLPTAAKIGWGDLKATSFVLKAQALLEGSPVGDPVTVTVQTADPILTIDDVNIKATLHGQDSTFQLLDSLKIYSILDKTKNIYSDGLTPYCGEDDGVKLNKEDKSDWTCTVNGQPYEGAELFTFDDEKNELTYKKHDAVGQVVITIPYKFTYKFGEKTFNVILTIN
ncbi:MAG: hypothetical protein KBS36_05025 [Bacteroidales bacterium]|nr:hypothetical protein [Candidatus Cryptobacteroides fimicaballi]